MDPANLNLFQFCVLHAMTLGEVKFSDLRDDVKSRGHRKSDAGFSNAMQRLEKVGLVEGRYETANVNGYPVREKYFKLTGEGYKVLEEARPLLRGPIQEEGA